MPIAAINDPILRRFRAALDEIYGERLERVVLFGSRARGDARADSDYDVAVFLRDLTDRPAELNRLADLGTDILNETGEFMPYRAGSYEERTPLMLALRSEGVDLGAPRPPPSSTRLANFSRKRRTCSPTVGPTRPGGPRISRSYKRHKR
jgi:predicted nucleotidyltransferase